MLLYFYFIVLLSTFLMSLLFILLLWLLQCQGVYSKGDFISSVVLLSLRVQIYCRADVQCSGQCGPVPAFCSLVQEVSGHEGTKWGHPGGARNRFPPHSGALHLWGHRRPKPQSQGESSSWLLQAMTRTNTSSAHDWILDSVLYNSLSGLWPHHLLVISDE